VEVGQVVAMGVVGVAMGEGRDGVAVVLAAMALTVVQTMASAVAEVAAVTNRGDHWKDFEWWSFVTQRTFQRYFIS
jgi:hypothetical protein